MAIVQVRFQKQVGNSIKMILRKDFIVNRNKGKKTSLGMRRHLGWPQSWFRNIIKDVQMKTTVKTNGLEVYTSRVQISPM